MNPGRILLAVLVALSFTSCGGGGDTASPLETQRYMPMSQAAATDSPLPCTGVVFVGLRGSGESSSGNLGMGRTIKAVYDEAASQMPGLLAKGIAYPAIAMLPLDVFLADVDSSVAIGRAEVTQFLVQQLAACPTQKFMLAGYSQGAAVVADVISRLDAATANHVVGVGMLGDPYFNPKAKEDAGRYDRKLSGVLDPRSEFDKGIVKKIASMCLKGDPICNYSYFPNLLFCMGFYSLCPHFKYDAAQTGKQSYAQRLGDLLVQRAKRETMNSPPVPVPSGTVVEFSIGISAGARPLGITSGSDGNLWFTESSDSINAIGRITPSGAVTETPLPSALAEPTGITVGPDANLWFIESSYNGWNPKIGQIDPVTRVVIEFDGFRGLSTGIATAPDGNLWFGQFDSINSITPLGVVNSFNLLHSFSAANCITVGPDGNLWSTVGGVELSPGTIYRITTSGAITEISTGVASGGGFPCIAAGPDGNIWFTGYYANVIVRLTPAGVPTTFSAGISPGAYPYSITAGPDGNMWFTEPGINKIGRITPDGAVTEFSVGGSPIGITAGPDGNIWFTEPGIDKIGWIKP